MVAEDLAGQADAGQPACRESIALGDGLGGRFPFDEFHTTGRAPGVPAAGVKLIDVRVLFEREDEAFSLRDLDGPESFNSELGHIPRLY